MRASAGDARVSVQHMFAFVPEGADRAAIEETARRRFGYSTLVVGGRNELLDHFHAMRERGVERFYVWFTDFAAPATLEAFGAEVICFVLNARSRGAVGEHRLGPLVVVADEAAVAERHGRDARVASTSTPG